MVYRILKHFLFGEKMQSAQTVGHYSQLKKNIAQTISITAVRNQKICRAKKGLG